MENARHRRQRRVSLLRERADVQPPLSSSWICASAVSCVMSTSRWIGHPPFMRSKSWCAGNELAPGCDTKRNAPSTSAPRVGEIMHGPHMAMAATMLDRRRSA